MVAPYSLPEGLTNEMIDAGTEKIVEKLKRSGAWEIYERGIFEEVPRAINCTSDSPAANHRKVIEIVTKVGKAIGPHMPCKSGCSKCCYQAVGITTHEANLIEKETGVKPMPVKTGDMIEQYGELDGLQQHYKGVVCPFLDSEDGSCQIYDVRPLACRAHYLATPYPDLCDYDKNKDGRTPNMNFEPVWASLVQMHFPSSEFGDIRQFFPNGLKKTPK